MYTKLKEEEEVKVEKKKGQGRERREGGDGQGWLHHSEEMWGQKRGVGQLEEKGGESRAVKLSVVLIMPDPHIPYHSLFHLHLLRCHKLNHLCLQGRQMLE